MGNQQTYGRTWTLWKARPQVSSGLKQDEDQWVKVNLRLYPEEVAKLEPQHEKIQVKAVVLMST